LPVPAPYKPAVETGALQSSESHQCGSAAAVTQLMAPWDLYLHHFYGEGLASHPVLHTHNSTQSSMTNQGMNVKSDWEDSE